MLDVKYKLFEIECKIKMIVFWICEDEYDRLKIFLDELRGYKLLNEIVWLIILEWFDYK